MLYIAPSHRQDSTYHSLCHSSRGAQAEARIRSPGIKYNVHIWSRGWRTLYIAPSHRQNSTYHSLCHTSRGAQAEARIRSPGIIFDRFLVCISDFWFISDRGDSLQLVMISKCVDYIVKLIFPFLAFLFCAIRDWLGRSLEV